MPYNHLFTRGDHLRMLNLLKGKKRGVYKWKQSYRPELNFKKSKFDWQDKSIYRVVFKMPNKIAKTWLYTDDVNYAEMFYMEAFFETFGFYPYLNDQEG